MALTTTQIRTAVIATLSGATAAATNVKDSQAVPINESGGAAIVVYTPKTTEVKNALFRRTDTVQIDGIVQGSVSDARLEFDVDTLEAQILTALDTAEPPLGIAQYDGGRMQFGDREINRGRSADDRRRAAVSIVFTVSYDVERVPVAVDGWNTLHVEVDPIDPAGTSRTDNAEMMLEVDP